jgi:uncharacterized protein YggE
MKTTAVSLALVLLAYSNAAFAQSSSNPPASPGVITVTGNAQVAAIPDEALVRVGIVRQAGTAKEAQEEANRIAQAILKAIGTLGIPAQRIQTSRLTISLMYAQQRPGSNESPRITGYSASNSVSVTLDNLTQIGPVVDAALDNGANQLEGVQFRLKDDATIRELALKRAVAEAKGKAAAMAEALFVTLGPVIEITESGISILPREDYGGTIGALSARAATPTPVSPGQIEINATVVLKYAIVSKY